MTPNQAVTKALKKLGVLAANESATGSEMADGIELLNDMLHSWELDGVNLQNYDLSSGDEMPFPQNHDTAIVYGLAVYAAPEYEIQVSAAVAAIAQGALDRLRNAYLDPYARLSVDSMLLPQYNTNDGSGL